MLAKRSLGAVTLRYQVNGGAGPAAGRRAEWNGGERYGPGNGDLLPRGAAAR